MSIEQSSITPQEQLADWSSMAKDAFAANALRAWQADWEIFSEFCRSFRWQPMPARQTLARGLVWGEIAKFLEFEARNLRDTRDRALVAVAYDTMCRREELVNLRIYKFAMAVRHTIGKVRAMGCGDANLRRGALRGVDGR